MESTDAFWQQPMAVPTLTTSYMRLFWKPNSVISAPIWYSVGVFASATLMNFWIELRKVSIFGCELSLLVSRSLPGDCAVGRRRCVRATGGTVDFIEIEE
jgi:hypothetical protein